MKKVLIISTSLEEQEKLEEVSKVHSPGAFQFQTTGSFGQAPEWWTQHLYDLVIIYLPADPVLQTYFFTKLRKDVPQDQALLLICPAISTAIMQLSQVFKKIKILKTPMSSFELYRGVVDVTTEYVPGKIQAQPRYLTDQEVVVSSDFKPGKIKARMKNMSVSGAFFESEDRDLQLDVDDLIRIQISVPNKKEYVFDAKVVWRKPQKVGYNIGYGVTFVDKDEVYQRLLKD
ncbi:MAG: hypothetical protein BroJett040_04780 [Oligoflexia bacterium]|nr:MAG: hypothetical protein BroJett040_04780 [Oligoflexia bacterium]